MKLLAMLWTIAIPLVVGAFFLSEVVTPAAEIKSSEANLMMLGRSDGGRLNSGYWFKETSPENGGTRVINIKNLEPNGRSEEHTSELQSLMRISYAVFCLKKK